MPHADQEAAGGDANPPTVRPTVGDRSGAADCSPKTRSMYCSKPFSVKGLLIDRESGSVYTEKVSPRLLS